MHPLLSQKTVVIRAERLCCQFQLHFGACTGSEVDKVTLLTAGHLSAIPNLEHVRILPLTCAEEVVSSSTFDFQYSNCHKSPTHKSCLVSILHLYLAMAMVGITRKCDLFLFMTTTTLIDLSCVLVVSFYENPNHPAKMYLCGLILKVKVMLEVKDRGQGQRSC